MCLVIPLDPSWGLENIFDVFYAFRNQRLSFVCFSLVPFPMITPYPCRVRPRYSRSLRLSRVEFPDVHTPRLLQEICPQQKHPQICQWFTWACEPKHMSRQGGLESRGTSPNIVILVSISEHQSYCANNTFSTPKWATNSILECPASHLGFLPRLELLLRLGLMRWALRFRYTFLRLLSCLLPPVVEASQVQRPKLW